MTALTLRGFILAEMNRRKLSMRQFAALIGVSHGTVSRFMADVEALPTLDFLVKLSRGTNADLVALLGLVYPEDVRQYDGDPEGRIFLKRYKELPEETREFIRRALMGG